MTTYEKSIKILEELFSKDNTFVLATVQNNCPSQRVVDTYYYKGDFWIVTYAKSNKVIAIEQNPHVSLCNSFYNFIGQAKNMGHPLQKENKDIRTILINVFEKWYFAHNNEDDETMCYVKVALESAFFHKAGIGYKLNFVNKTVEDFPFTPQIAM